MKEGKKYRKIRRWGIVDVDVKSTLVMLELNVSHLSIDQTSL